MPVPPPAPPVARLATEADRDRFDAFVHDHPRGHPLQLWSWPEVKRADGWGAVRMLVEEGDRIAAAVSIVERRLPGGTALWLAHRGPVAEPGADATRTLEAFVRAHGRARGVVALRCDPEWPVTDGERLAAAGWRHLPVRQRWPSGALEPVRVWRISLEGGEGAVWGRFDAGTRSCIRRAERKGVTVRPGTSRDVAPFYALERSTGRRKGFPVRSLAFFERLWRAWNEAGDAYLAVAEYDGRLIAGAWWVRCGQGTWGQFAAMDRAYRHLQPSEAVYWAGIRWAIGRGCTFCDFGGIDHRRDDGVWAFKKGFGPGDTRFGGEYDLVVRPLAYPAFRLAEEARLAWHDRRWAGLGRLVRLRAAARPQEGA